MSMYINIKQFGDKAKYIITPSVGSQLPHSGFILKDSVF